MDPLSFLFTAYLDTVQSRVQSHLTDTLGTEVKALIIEHRGVKVPFHYQLWRIQNNSVCARDRGDVLRYSTCTVAAKGLFAALCNQLSKNTSDHWRLVKSRNMYCNAAVSYRETVARVGVAQEPTKAEEARAACSAAVVRAMGSRDVRVIAERRRVCEESG